MPKCIAEQTHSIIASRASDASVVLEAVVDVVAIDDAVVDDAVDAVVVAADDVALDDDDDGEDALPS